MVVIVSMLLCRCGFKVVIESALILALFLVCFSIAKIRGSSALPRFCFSPFCFIAGVY